MNNFIDERKKKLEDFKTNIRKKQKQVKSVDIPDGIFIKCENCNSAIFEKSFEANYNVCPNCDYHFRLSAKERIKLVADDKSFFELYSDIQSFNPLKMPEYDNKLIIGKKLSEMNEAFYCGIAKIVNIQCAIGVLDANFMMGSMGSAVGEKVTRLVEYATKEKLPVIIFSASGGARMQEGILSLMQMTKTSAALFRHYEQGLLFISVLTHPTTGGVAASFASLGDIIIAEKGALIGFAGERVIKQTINQDLPEGFQTAKFQLNHGQVDLVVNRRLIRKTLYRLLRLHQTERGIYEQNSLEQS